MANENDSQLDFFGGESEIIPPTPEDQIELPEVLNYLKDDYNPQLTFYGTAFAGLCFPARSPKKRHWMRTNNRDTLIIRAGLAPKISRKKIVRDDNNDPVLEELKVPSGIIPRHIMVYLSHYWTERKNTGDRSKEIPLGHSLADFLNKLNMSKGGNSYKTLLEQVRRLFYCQIGYIRETDSGVEDYEPRRLAQKLNLWWSEIDPEQQSVIPSSIEISDEMAQILDKSMPLNLDTVQALGSNVLAFDLYAWLALKSYNTGKPVTISFQALHDQFGAGYSEVRDFKKKLKKAFELVSKHTRFNHQLKDKGILLMPSSPEFQPTKQGSSQKLRDWHKHRPF